LGDEMHRAIRLVVDVAMHTGKMTREQAIAYSMENEAISEEERKRQRYIDDPDVHAPSVISLNAIAAAHGVNEYLFRVTGLRTETARNDNLYFQARTGEVRFDLPRNDPGCLECGVSSNSRYGRGNAVSLPVREPRQ